MPPCSYARSPRLAQRKATAKITGMNAAVREADRGIGFMVGAGKHLSYAGLIEAFKPKAKVKGRGEKRPIDGRDSAASWLARAGEQFYHLFAGACLG